MDAQKMIALASELSREWQQQREVAEFHLDVADTDLKPRALAVVMRWRSQREVRVAQLREAANETPDDIGAELLKIANRLDTTGGDVSDLLLELAAKVVNETERTITADGLRVAVSTKKSPVSIKTVYGWLRKADSPQPIDPEARPRSYRFNEIREWIAKIKPELLRLLV